MSLELKICKDMGSLNATAFAFISLAGVVNSIVDDRDFLLVFNSMLNQLGKLYTGLCRPLEPVCGLQTENEFKGLFTQVQKDYQGCYLSAASQPRKYAENSHERYLELVTFPQVKTSYPLLKSAFASLYTLMDKWVTNDAWLVMSADGVFKAVHRWLLELQEINKRDEDDAWLVYRFGVPGIRSSIASLGQIGSSLERFPAAVSAQTVSLQKGL